MRQARLLVPDCIDGLYHVVSRVVDRRMVFGEEEKRHFRRLLLAYAGFSGIDVVAWCLMDNHFHLLLRVPAREANDPGQLPEEVVLRRMGLIYNAAEMEEVRRILGMCAAPESRKLFLERYTRRMGDLGKMMKALKQRFSQWFNRKHERTGTLWEDRYKSVVVEIDDIGTLGHVARIVAAYIDLNPVRAGMVEDPKDYAWCGYGMAARGEKESREGIVRLWGVGEGEEAALASHRLFLFEEGSDEWAEKTPEGRMQDPRTGGMKARAGIDARKVWAERKRGGRLALPVILRLKVRFFTDGGVIGGREFVEKVSTGMAKREKAVAGPSGGLVGSDRLDGSREGQAQKASRSGVPMRFGDWKGVHVLRDLRKSVVG
jgi:putative transposase